MHNFQYVIGVISKFRIDIMIIIFRNQKLLHTKLVGMIRSIPHRISHQ